MDCAPKSLPCCSSCSLHGGFPSATRSRRQRTVFPHAGAMQCTTLSCKPIRSGSSRLQASCKIAAQIDQKRLSSGMVQRRCRTLLYSATGMLAGDKAGGVWEDPSNAWGPSILLGGGSRQIPDSSIANLSLLYSLIWMFATFHLATRGRNCQAHLYT